MTLFYVVRHGETDFNRDGRYQGHSDVPMNENGRRQSHALAARLAGIPLDGIYSSDLARARECASIIASGGRVVLDRNLREIDVGTVAGMTPAEVAEREPSFWASLQTEPGRARFPGGESVCDLKRRALEAFTLLGERHPGGHLGVVTHKGLIQVLVAEIMGASPAGRHRPALPNCGLAVIEWTAAERRMCSLEEVT